LGTATTIGLRRQVYKGVDLQPLINKLMNKQIKQLFSVVLKKNENQALELGKYAINFISNGNPGPKVLERTKLFHTDSVLCGLSALALKCNAPHVLRNEALESATRGTKKDLAKVFGSHQLVPVEKAIVSNASAVREWDSNGTVFGYATGEGRQAGEFGHNDFYPVVVAAAHLNPKIDGATALKAMALQDEIRGRLCEVFSLKTYKIDHVVHGAIASICVYGALLGASAEQIESGIGMFVAHYIPFRAIRAGKQLSDSKGASAALSTEAAIMSIRRSMKGFIGPKDIFRNPEAIFRLNEKTKGDSPFDITLSNDGDDFAVMGMHFKLGLYEHQSAGALEGLQKLIYESKFVTKASIDDIANINIIAYEPAFGIIGDPAKKNPTTRQSADHSMVYIISTILRKAFETPNIGKKLDSFNNLDELWKLLMLEPKDYSHKAVFNTNTRKLMEKCTFEHGGKAYDEKYPEGIPTSIVVKLKNGETFDSKFVMFPSGHSRNTAANLKDILNHKFNVLGRLALKEDQLKTKLSELNNLDKLTNEELRNLYECRIQQSKVSVDDQAF
jgi:2-methylcitrate dehydratase